MTVIVEGIKTKKELKEAADLWNQGERGLDVPGQFQDPAIVNPLNQGNPFTFALVKAAGLSFVCTNHPKRSWFAQISVSPSGKVIVK